MKNMKLMLTKTPPEDIKQHILPVVYNALDAESSQVQVILLFWKKYLLYPLHVVYVYILV